MKSAIYKVAKDYLDMLKVIEISGINAIRVNISIIGNYLIRYLIQDANYLELESLLKKSLINQIPEQWRY
jgi:hypothetical protein